MLSQKAKAIWVPIKNNKEFFMKSLVLALSVLIITSLHANAADYSDDKCIADALQAYNSDIYYNLSSSEIRELLIAQVPVASAAAEKCEKEKPCNGNLEVQFIGKIQSSFFAKEEAGRPARTYFTIGNFTHFKVNPLCPLDEALAEQALIFLQGKHDVKDGSPVSGVLIYSTKFSQFSIE
jgi:hypothetical protein